MLTINLKISYNAQEKIALEKQKDVTAIQWLCCVRWRMHNDTGFKSPCCVVMAVLSYGITSIMPKKASITIWA